MKRKTRNVIYERWFQLSRGKRIFLEIYFMLQIFQLIKFRLLVKLSESASYRDNQFVLHFI